MLNIFERVVNFTALSKWDSQEGLNSLIYVTAVEKNNGSKWLNVNFLKFNINTTKLSIYCIS